MRGLRDREGRPRECDELCRGCCPVLGCGAQREGRWSARAPCSATPVCLGELLRLVGVGLLLVVMELMVLEVGVVGFMVHRSLVGWQGSLLRPPGLASPPASCGTTPRAAVGNGAGSDACGGWQEGPQIGREGSWTREEAGGGIHGASASCGLE